MKWVQVKTSAMRPVEHVTGAQFGGAKQRPNMIREYRTIWIPTTRIIAVVEPADGSEFGGIIIDGGPTFDLAAEEVTRILIELGKEDR